MSITSNQALAGHFRVSIAAVALAAVFLMAAGQAAAQEEVEESTDAGIAAADEEEQERGREKVEIKPYTGPPVYLPEEEAPPAPTEVSSKIVEQKYPDTDIPHFERRIVRYSDESYESDGPHKEFYSSGEIYVSGEYEKNRATGEWAYYHPNGTLAKKVSYVRGLPDGKVEMFDDAGRLTSVRSYKAGVRHGEWADFDYDDEEQRQLRAYEYQDGKPHGKWKVWYKNGAIRQEQTFAEGKRNGPAVEWARSGEKRAEANFVDDKRDGETVIYRRDGAVVRRIYKEGRLIDQTESFDG